MKTNKFEQYPTTKVMRWKRNQIHKEAYCIYLKKLIHAEKSQDNGYPWGQSRGEGTLPGLVMFCLLGGIGYLGMFIENSLSCILKICAFLICILYHFTKATHPFFRERTYKESA